MSTPLSELIPSLRETVFKHLKSYLGGEGELSSIMDSLEFWYDRLRDKEHPDLPMWQDLPSNEQDQLFDAWHAALEDFFRQRLTQSDPETSSRLFKPVVDPCPDCGLVGAHFCTRGMPLIDCPECGAHGPHVCITGGFVPGVSSLSPASSVVPAPLVPDAVKIAQDGSVCEVEPLGEITETPRGFQQILFLDRSGQGCRLYQSSAFDEERVDAPGTSAIRLDTSPHLNRQKVQSLVAHLQAWLATGSFDLKGLPSSPPSSEDKELDASQVYDTLKPFKRYVSNLDPGPHKRTMEKALNLIIYGVESLDALAEASTTPQKGGQGA